MKYQKNNYGSTLNMLFMGVILKKALINHAKKIICTVAEFF